MLRVLLDENNDLPPGGPRLVGGVASAAVALRAVFSTQAGEWPFNRTFGMMWRQAVFGKFFNAAITSQATAATANTVPEITPVVGNQVTLDTIEGADDRQVNIAVNDIRLRAGGAEPFTFTVTTSF